MMNRNATLVKLKELAPWHQKIALGDDLFTTDGNSEVYSNPNKNNVSVVDCERFRAYLSRFYPNGLKGKRVLDVGCNSGAYCMVAHQLGASYTFGFDPRPHWINQANFVKNHFELSDEEVQFEMGTVDQMLPKLENFDIVIFCGVLYHLPFPIQALVGLGQITKELIIVDSATRNDIPENCLVPTLEGVKPLMSGVDGLSWYPGGPEVVRKILRWAGFEHALVTNYVKDTFHQDKRKSRTRRDLGRLRMVGVKQPELIEVFRKRTGAINKQI